MTTSRPPGRKDKRKPRDNRPTNKPKPSKPKAPVLSQAAIDRARQLAREAPPFSADARARLAVVLAPMAAHIAAQQRPARVRAA